MPQAPAPAQPRAAFVLDKQLQRAFEHGATSQRGVLFGGLAAEAAAGPAAGITNQ
jgi:hypothetical protein